MSVDKEDFTKLNTPQLAVRIAHLRGVKAIAEKDKHWPAATALGMAIDRAEAVFRARPDHSGIILPMGETKPTTGLTPEADELCDYYGLDRKTVAASAPNEILESVDVARYFDRQAVAPVASTQHDQDAPGSTISAKPAQEPPKERKARKKAKKRVVRKAKPTVDKPTVVEPHGGAVLAEPVVESDAQAEMDKLGMTLDHMAAVMDVPDVVTLKTVREAVEKIGGAA